MPAKAREIPLNGRLRTADDPTTIGESDFTTLTNLRYNDNNPRGVGGMSKFNPTQTPSGYRYINSGMNFRKGQPNESHILVSASPSAANTAGKVYRTATTTLSTAIDNDDTTLVFLSGAYFSDGDYVLMDSEIILLGTENPSGTYAGCTRGCLGTIATAHSTGTVVMQSLPYQSLFHTTELWGDSAGAQRGRFSVAPQGTMCYANGVDTVVWGGEEYRCAEFIIDNGSSKIWDYTEQVTNTRTDTNQLATVQTTGAGPYTSTWYIGSVLPLSGFKLYFGTVNPKTGTTISVKYWDNVTTNDWASVGAIVDGTSDGSTTLKKNGFITWVYGGSDQLTKEAPRFYEKRYLYWYQVTVTDANEDFNGTTISYVTTVLPPQQIREIWDGNERGCASAIFSDNGEYKDFTSRVVDSTYSSGDAYTHADFSVYDATTAPGALGAITYNQDYIYFGFVEQAAGFRVNVGGDLNNTSAANIAVDYWNGSAWVALTVSDGTSVGGKTWQQSGYVTWKPPAINVEQRQSFTVCNPADQLVNIPLYYYRVSFSAAVSNHIHIFYVTGVAAAKPIRGYRFSEMHQNRLCLFNNHDGRKNSFIMSAYRTLNVFNGSDSYEFLVGNDEPIVAAAPMFLRHGSLTSDMLLICKNGETWGLGGYGTAQDPFSLYRISTVIGCVAPASLISVPLGDPDNPGQTRQVLIWQAYEGIMMFDGVNVPVEISTDIRDLFDPRSTTYIGASVAPNCSGYYDPVNKEYHWIVPGAAEWAFDLRRRKWFRVDRGTAKYLNGGFPVQSFIGNNYTFGFDTSGYVYHLEEGNTFDGNDITHTLKTSDIALEGNNISVNTWFRGFKLICKDSGTDNSINVTYFPDGATSGTALTAYSPNVTGYRICQHVEMARGSNPATTSTPTYQMGQAPIFHALQFSLATDDQTVGFEPLMLAMYYEVTQPDIWGRMSN